MLLAFWQSNMAYKIQLDCAKCILTINKPLSFFAKKRACGSDAIRYQNVGSLNFLCVQIQKMYCSKCRLHFIFVMCVS